MVWGCDECWLALDIDNDPCHLKAIELLAQSKEDGTLLRFKLREQPEFEELWVNLQRRVIERMKQFNEKLREFHEEDFPGTLEEKIKAFLEKAEMDFMLDQKAGADFEYITEMDVDKVQHEP